MQRFTHLFRTLRLTQDFAVLLGDTFVRLFDYCTGGRRTKLLKDPSIGLAEQVHYYRLGLLDLASYVRGRGAVEALFP